jgi:tRNA 2-thiocytidine biosynthesis protein TtcA
MRRRGKLPDHPCTLCGSQENLQRKQVRRMLEAWERDAPGRTETIARALADVRPAQLADPTLFDFPALGRQGEGALPDVHAWLGEGEPVAGNR